MQTKLRVTMVLIREENKGAVEDEEIEGED